MRDESSGFSLVELMTALVIIGILAAIAIPNYMKYTAHSRRAEAQSAVYGLAQALERYYTINNTYVGVTLAGLRYPPNVPQTGNSPNYTLGINVTSPSTYVITATRAGVQVGDECGDLTLTEAGVRGPAGVGSDCWIAN